MSSASDQSPREFRRALDSLVTHVSQVSSESSASLISRLSGTSSYYQSVYSSLLFPLVELLDLVHEAAKKVEEATGGEGKESDELSQRASSTKKGTKKPVPPPSIMSISHLRAVYTTIEILWSWGVEAPLSAAGLINKNSSQVTQGQFPKSIQISVSTLSNISEVIQNSLAKNEVFAEVNALWTVVLTIDRSVRHIYFRGMMMQRNFQRLVVASLAVDAIVNDKVCVLKATETSVMYPHELLITIEKNDNLLLYIQALQHASRIGCRTVQLIAAGILSSILLSTGLDVNDSSDPVDRLGLGILLRTHLNKGVSDKSNPTDLLVRIAKLVTSVPAACTTRTSFSKALDLQSPNSADSSIDRKGHFFDNISSQTLLLMISTLKRINQLDTDEESNCILRVCVLMTARIAHMSPRSAYEYIFRPLSECLEPVKMSNIINASTLKEVKTGADVEIGVIALHWILTCFPLSAPVLGAMSRTNILFSLFSLQIFLMSTTNVIATGLNELVADITIKLLRFFDDPTRIVYILEDLIVNGLKYDYAKDSSGGIVITSKSKGKESLYRNNEKVDNELNLLSALLQEAETAFGEETVDVPFLDSDMSGNMSSLLSRTQIVCQMLSTTISSTALDTDNKINKHKRETRKSHKSNLIIESDDDDQPKNNSFKIASQLYLRMLSGYLRLRVEKAQCCDHDTGDTPDFPPPHICGGVLLAIKKHLSLDSLLHSATEIIKLLGLFLRNRVENISRLPDQKELKYHSVKGGRTYVESLLKKESGTNNTKPLIEEITSSHGTDISASQNCNRHNAFNILSKFSINDNCENVDDEYNDEEDIIMTVLALLVSMLEVGSQQRKAEEESMFREVLLPHLVVIAGQDKNVEVAQTASDLCLVIMTRGTPPTNHTNVQGNLKTIDFSECDISAFQKICNEAKAEYLFDESPAMRGLGVRNIIVALREPIEPLTSTDLQEATALLLHMLQDPESFVYLNVVHAIGRLIDHHRDNLFKKFLNYYSVGVVSHAPLTKETHSPTSGEYQLSLRHRAILSEAICCALRRADQLAHKYIPQVVAVCIRICRRRTNLQSSLQLANTNDCEDGRLIDVDLTRMRVSVIEAQPHGDDEGDLSDKALRDVCVSADEVLFRQSAFSLLAEATGMAGLTVGHYLMDVVDVAVGALKHETADINNNYKYIKDVIPVRRSASFLLRYIVTGLEKGDYSITDMGSQMKVIYRALKIAARDNDDIVKFHAESGLSTFDSVLRSQLTLTEEQLTGENLPKIRVIH